MSDDSHLFEGLLLGGLLGAALGVCFAPATGDKVREKIKESIIPMNDLLYFIGENELFYPLIFKKKFKEIRKIFSDTIKDVELISRLSKDYILDDEFADLKGNLEKIEKSMNELLIDIKSNINEYGSIDINEIFSNKIDLNNKVRQ